MVAVADLHFIEELTVVLGGQKPPECLSSLIMFYFYPRYGNVFIVIYNACVKLCHFVP